MNYFLFSFSETISLFGNQNFMLIFATIVSLIILFWHKEERLAGFILFNYGIAMTLVIVLKYVVEKERSVLALVYEPSYAYPSGHVAGAAVTAILLYYLSRFVRNKKINIFMKIFSIFWIISMIFARLYLNVHDIYDVLASIIIALYVFYLSTNLKIFKAGLLKREIKL